MSRASVPAATSRAATASPRRARNAFQPPFDMPETPERCPFALVELATPLNPWLTNRHIAPYLRSARTTFIRQQYEGENCFRPPDEDWWPHRHRIAPPNPPDHR